MERVMSIALVCTMVYIGSVSAYPSGAPASVCDSMQPNVYQHGNAQISPAPYWLTVDSDSVTAGDTLTVTVNGGPGAQIRGILLQARSVDTMDIMGDFLELADSADFKGVACSGADSAVTHRGRSDKTLPLTFSWRSPQDLSNNILFRATIVEEKVTYWMNVDSPNILLSACTPEQSYQAGSCVTSFLTDFGSDQRDLLTGNLDVISFCRSIDNRYAEFTSCTSVVGAGCHAVYTTSMELYQNASSTYCDCDVEYNCLVDPCDTAVQPSCPEAAGSTCLSKYCGGCWAVWVDGNNDPVPCETGNCTQKRMQSIYDCQLQFANALTTAAEAAAGTGGFCEKLTEAIEDSYACLEELEEHCGHTPSFQGAKSAVTESKKQYEDIYCGGDSSEGCGLIPLQLCFKYLSGNITQFPENCGAFVNISMCLEAYEARCGETDIEDIYGDGIDSSIALTVKMCGDYENCPDFQQRLEAMALCMSVVQLPDTHSLDNTCSYMGDVTECFLTAADDCDLIGLQVNPGLAKLRDLLGAFNCELTFGGHTFEPTDSECNLEDMVECANGVVELLGLNPITRTTNLEKYLLDLENVNIDLNGPLSNDFCSAVNEASSVDCFISEFNKCFEFVNMATAPNNYAYTGLQSGLPMPNISSESLDNSLGPVSPLIEAFDKTSAVLELRCAPGCENTTARGLGFGICVASAGYTDDFYAEIGLDFYTVINKYNSGQDYSAECSKLESAKTCADTYMEGCAFTELSVNQLLGTPAFYQVLHLCNVQFDFPIKDTSLGCDDDSFAQNIMKLVHTNCDAYSLTTNSIQNRDSDGICSQLQLGIECLNTQSQCCEIKQKTVLPRFHTLALFNQAFNCDIRVPGGGIEVQPMGTCDYMEVLSCYLPLLRLGGIQEVGTLDKALVQNILSLKENFTSQQCLPESDFEDIKSCVSEKTSGCTFLAICDSQPSDSSHKPLPLGDLLGFKDILDMCHPACADISPQSVERCYSPLTMLAFTHVAASDLIGAEIQEQCQALQTMFDCIEQAVGNCPSEINRARTHLNVDSIGVVRVQALCDVDLEFLSGNPQEMTTPVVTIGAGHVRAEMGVLIAVAILGILASAVWA